MKLKAFNLSKPGGLEEAFKKADGVKHTTETTSGSGVDLRCLVSLIR